MRAIAVAVVLLVGYAFSDASAMRRGLTADMIITALQSAHVTIQPGSTLQLLERSEGRWHDFRLDTFKVRVHDNHFVIEGDTTELN